MSNFAQMMAQAAKIAHYYGNGKESQPDQNEFMTCCPVHKDDTPSFHITVTDRLLVRCHGGCEQSAIIAKLKEDGLWHQTKAAPTGSKKRTNIPAHAIPDFSQIPGPAPSAIYTYTNEDGEECYWVIRHDNNGKKQIRPFSSIKGEDGVDRFDWSLDIQPRYLYNLYNLVKNPDLPVLVVEGEKAADFAKSYYAGQYVVVCWLGGAKNYKKTDWSPLYGRNVTLWPDNDEPGVKCMLDIAALIYEGSDKKNLPKITFKSVQPGIPDGWDIADPFEEDRWSPESIMYKAVQLDEEDLPKVASPVSNQSEVLRQLEQKYIRLLNGTDFLYVDITSGSWSLLAGDFPFKKYNKSGFLQIENARVLDQATNKMLTKGEIYIGSTQVDPCRNATYDPTTTDRLVTREDGKYLNLFLGYKHKPQACDPSIIEPFFRHIRETLDPEPAKYLLTYIAQMVQQPSKKPGTMVILTGQPGVGKTVIADIIGSMIGDSNYASVESSIFTSSNFNSIFGAKLFVNINELNIAAAKDKTLIGKIKSWITDPVHVINAKYMAARPEPSYHRFFATTNVNIPIDVSTDDRRINIFHVAPTFIHDRSHFNELYALKENPQALAGLMHYFVSYNLDNAIDLMRPLMTEERALSMRPENPIERFIYDICESGHLPKELHERIPHPYDLLNDHVVIARSIVHEFLRKEYMWSATSNHTTTILRKYIPRHTCQEGHEDNQIRFKYLDDRGNITSTKDRVWEFYPLPRLRQQYEMIKNTAIQWSTVGHTETDEEQANNIIDLNQKRKDKEIF